MFSGIIEQVGEVIKIEDCGDRRIVVKTKFSKQDIKIGSSVCCNGVCLTVHTIKKNKDSLDLSFDVSKETLKCTNF